MKIKKIILIDDIQELPDEIVIKYKGVDFRYQCPYEHVADNPRPLPGGIYFQSPAPDPKLSRPCC